MDKKITADLKFSIVPNWVLEADISDRAVRVYAILARYADNETLEAFPRRELIAEKARCHKKSIDRALDELEHCGAVVKQHRVQDGVYKSNVYILKRVGTGVSLGGDTGVPRVGTGVSPITILKELEPLNDIKSEQFEQFWAHYPNKLDKARARKAFNKLSQRKGKLAIAGAKAFSDDPNLPPKRFIPYPATWLNGERWDDGPLPPRTRRGESVSRADENAARLRELEQGGK
jgi:hypothetical protein